MEHFVRVRLDNDFHHNCTLYAIRNLNRLEKFKYEGTSIVSYLKAGAQGYLLR